MNTKVMIALPGEKYYAVPREELEKYAVPKGTFDLDLTAMWKNRLTVFHTSEHGDPLVVGARDEDEPGVLGIRG